LPEIKTESGGRRYPGVEEKVLALLAARRFGARATIQAFDERTLRRLRELDPAQRTMLLASPRRLEAAGVESVHAVRWERGRRHRPRHGPSHDRRAGGLGRPGRARAALGVDGERRVGP